MRFEDHYTQVPNGWMRDDRLTLKARGLLAQLMTHRPGWVVSVAALVRDNPEGRDAIAGAVRELEAYGYLKREDQEHGEGGKFGSVPYVLSDPGITAPSTDYPSTGDPSTVEPSTDEPHPKKTISSEDQESEDQQKTSAIDAPGARDDVEAVCSAMAEHVYSITGRRPQVVKTWRRDARLLLDTDGHDVEAVLAAVSWVGRSPFWASNVMSPRKLREKWWTLDAQARNVGGHRMPSGAESTAALMDSHHRLFGTES